MSPRLANTHLAALYLLMLDRPDESTQAFTESDVEQAKRRIYDWAKRGRLTKHGGDSRGQARWNLREIHALVSKA